MEYIKSVESRNFRITVSSTERDKPYPDPNVPVTATVYGNSVKGLLFCASSDCLALVNSSLHQKGVPGIVRGYELALSLADNSGYLDDPKLTSRLTARTRPVMPTTPGAIDIKNPMDGSAIHGVTEAMHALSVKKPTPADAPAASAASAAASAAAVPAIAEPAAAAEPEKRPFFRRHASTSNKI